MRTDDLYLVDMLEAADAIASFIKDCDGLRFCQDHLLQSAVTLKLVVIGEAASKVSEATRSAHQDIPWPLIRAFRNHAVHAYFDVSWSRVWDLAASEVPPLRTQIESVLLQHFPEVHRQYVSRRTSAG